MVWYSYLFQNFLQFIVIHTVKVNKAEAYVFLELFCFFNDPADVGNLVSSSSERKSESEVAQSCLTLCDPVDCIPPGSSFHGILQARIVEWVAISFSRESSQPRDRTQVSCIAGRFFNCLSYHVSLHFLRFSFLQVKFLLTLGLVKVKVKVKSLSRARLFATP